MNLKKDLEIALFYSASETDYSFVRAFLTHLQSSPLGKVVGIWHAEHIIAGEDHKQVTKRHLKNAEIILLLISADFLASHEDEIAEALTRHQRGEAHLISLLLRPVISLGDLKEFSRLPKNGTSLAEQGLQHSLPHTSFDPPIKTAGDSSPRTIPLWQVSPRCPCSRYPQDPIDDPTMILRWTAHFWLLRWQQGSQLLPLLIRSFSSSHPPFYRLLAICKQALVHSASFFAF